MVASTFFFDYFYHKKQKQNQKKNICDNNQLVKQWPPPPPPPSNGILPKTKFLFVATNTSQCATDKMNLSNNCLLIWVKFYLKILFCFYFFIYIPQWKTQMVPKNIQIFFFPSHLPSVSFTVSHKIFMATTVSCGWKYNKGVGLQMWQKLRVSFFRQQWTSIRIMEH